MERTKRNLLLTFLAFILAILSAAFSLSVFSYARADEPEDKTITNIEKTQEEFRKYLEIWEKLDKEEQSKVLSKHRSAEIGDYSSYRRITEGTITTLYDKVVVIDGRDIFGGGDHSSNNQVYTFGLSDGNIFEVHITVDCIYIYIRILDNFIDAYEMVDPVVIYFFYNDCEYGPFGDLTGSNYVAYRFPESDVTALDSLPVNYATTEFNISVNECESAGIYWYELSDKEPEPDNPTPDNPTSGSHSRSTPYDDVDSGNAFIKFGAIAGLFCLGLMCFIPFSKKKKNKK
ncbi:MAG: hypothetical protein IJQ07_05140 [Clostridia bacterium]|nr:hypothetical protein [Clostridia bacterium]